MIYKILVKFLLFLFIGIQSWFVYVAMSYPVMGISVVKQSEGNWFISKIEPRNGVSTVDVKAGDQILKIDGKSPGEVPLVIKWNTIEQADTLQLNRDGREWTVSFLDVPRFSSYDSLSVCIAAVSFICAILLLFRLPHSRSAQVLAFVFLDFETVYMSLGASVRGDSLGKMSICLFLMLLPVLCLHFFVAFFKEKGVHVPRVRSFNYFYIAVALSVLIWQFVFLSTSELAFTLYRLNLIFVISCFVVGLLLNLVFLTRVYWKHRKEKSYISMMLSTVWVSLFLSFMPIILFCFIPQLVYGHVWLDSFYMSLFVGFFPATLAYLVVTKRLYDINLVLRRILITALISIVPSGLFIGIIRLFFGKAASGEQLFILSLVFILVLTTVLYSLEYFITKLEPVLFPRKYFLQSALKKIARTLGSITSFRELRDLILVDIVNTLQVAGGAIIFKYKESLEIFDEGTIDRKEIHKLLDSGRLYHPTYSCFEINRHEEYTSYFIMTPKKTGAILGTEERQWLNLIISYLAVSLENVHLIRKLTVKLEHLVAQFPNEQEAGDFNWFRKLMFELQEKERVRIATDLHDTTMQDLFFLKERLHSLLEKYAFTPEDRSQLVSLIDYIDVINSNLRQSCFELHPYLLKEIGLVETIEKLVELEAAVSSFEIDFEAHLAETLERRDLETKRHIFRMVQELINNAKKHSHASRVTVELGVAGENIYLNYEDDGVGFETDKTAIQEIGSHGIGMEQMKSRILFLNGEFHIRSAQGKGLTFNVTIPWKAS